MTEFLDKIRWSPNNSNLRAGAVRKWIDGNYYQKQNGKLWRRFSSIEEVSLKKYKERFSNWDAKKHREYMRDLERNVDLCILLPENIIVYLKDLHELFAFEKES